MKIIQLSHLDHGLSSAQVEFIQKRFADRDAFFIESFDLPEELGTVRCALYGPAMGDDPICDDMPETYETSGLDNANPDLIFAKRGSRTYPSRILMGVSSRPTRTVTVIAGPLKEKCSDCYGSGLYSHFDGPMVEMTCAVCRGSGIIESPCVLYTAFGGPLAAKELGDPTLNPEECEASELFWGEHALAEDVLADDDVARYERESEELIQSLKPGISGVDLHKILFGT